MKDAKTKYKGKYYNNYDYSHKLIKKSKQYHPQTPTEIGVFPCPRVH
jgi:hypothetical protein